MCFPANTDVYACVKCLVKLFPGLTRVPTDCPSRRQLTHPVGRSLLLQLQIWPTRLMIPQTYHRSPTLLSCSLISFQKGRRLKTAMSLGPLYTRCMPPLLSVDNDAALIDYRDSSHEDEEVHCLLIFRRESRGMPWSDVPASTSEYLLARTHVTQRHCAIQIPSDFHSHGTFQNVRYVLFNSECPCSFV
jgi:hypothetical protein